MVQMIRMMANVNCKTTRTFLGVTSALAALKVPLRTFTGWKDERKKAKKVVHAKLAARHVHMTSAKHWPKYACAQYDILHRGTSSAPWRSTSGRSAPGVGQPSEPVPQAPPVLQMKPQTTGAQPESKP